MGFDGRLFLGDIKMGTDTAPQSQGPPQRVLELQASLRQLDNRDWWLWLTAICILFLLCFAVFSLSFPSIWRQEEIFFQERLDIGIRGLLGLILLFSAFALYQQYLLKQTRSKLAAQIGVAAELHGRAEVIERLEILDPMTGLFNRRFAIEYLPSELIRAERQDYPLTVMMLNLDGFKQINDAYGRAVGDSLLEKFARQMRKSIRSADLPVRMGGDQFMVILPECTIQEIQYPLRRMAECEFECNGKRIAVPFSVGSTEYRRGELPAELLQRAADDLYTAKKKRSA
jgi:diguanylate cyclase (GGDEF)-like protein